MDEGEVAPGKTGGDVPGNGTEWVDFGSACHNSVIERLRRWGVEKELVPSVAVGQET